MRTNLVVNGGFTCCVTTFFESVFPTKICENRKWICWSVWKSKLMRIVLFNIRLLFWGFCLSTLNLRLTCDRNLSAQPISTRKTQSRKLKPINLCGPYEFLKNIVCHVLIIIKSCYFHHRMNKTCITMHRYTEMYCNVLQCSSNGPSTLASASLVKS